MPQKKAKDITTEEFDTALREIVEEECRGGSMRILQIPGVYEVLSEYYNNDVIDLCLRNNQISHKVVRVEQVLADRLQLLLDSGAQVPNEKESAVLQTFSADFGEGMQADIKLCNGDTGPWIDAVLFQDGQEILALEPQYERLLGKYTFFPDDETCYIVELSA